jgi:glycosyltransferase involved in cell wall biosynthesis
LAEFLRAAQSREDVKFVIVCPSWLRSDVCQSLQEFGVLLDRIEIVTPQRQPWAYQAYQAYQTSVNWRQKQSRKPGRLARLTGSLKQLMSDSLTPIARWLISARSLRSLILFVMLGLLLLPLLAISLLLWLCWKMSCRLISPFSVFKGLSRKLKQTLQKQVISQSQSFFNLLLIQLYQLMEEAEFALLESLIDRRTDILAWYCPTAFWPQFNQIKAPRLMCVPDVVTDHFPVGFSLIGGDRTLYRLRQIEQSIRGCRAFVTYSEDVKWRTLVDRHQVHPEQVTVIPHGPNRLDDLITISGFPDNAATTRSFCRNLLHDALGKQQCIDKLPKIGLHPDFQFIFYASQFRPNKNVRSLLKSYEYLQRQRHLPHKLILTGHPQDLGDAATYIVEHHLQEDVLCLNGLSSQELAACYHLADLAVNPSLSEGGCPFTFAEAMSVGTPSVMARIPVTEEIIVDPELQAVMLFDPYDWRSMAERIEWALNHTEKLLHLQRPLYEKLTERTWETVVDEHITLLDQLAKSVNQLR